MNVHAAALAQSYPLDEQTSAFAGDVIGDLSQFPKRLSPKYFYDAAGSELFEQITVLPEYYPTRTELGILRSRGDEIASIIPEGRRAGGIRRRRHHQGPPAAGALRFRRLCPGRHFRRLPERAGRAPCARIFPISASIRLPPISPRRLPCRPKSKGCPRSGSFRDRRSAISSRHEARAFLRSARDILGEGAQMIIGVDLEKNERVLYDAYNDAAGVTARFNLNVLVRINRELGGNFDVSAFMHRSVYNRERHRIEMHLIAKKAQTVRILGRNFSFRPGESIHTELSYKYSLDRFTALARDSGWSVRESWTDRDRMFSVHALAASA